MYNLPKLCPNACILVNAAINYGSRTALPPGEVSTHYALTVADEAHNKILRCAHCDSSGLTVEDECGNPDAEEWYKGLQETDAPRPPGAHPPTPDMANYRCSTAQMVLACLAAATTCIRELQGYEYAVRPDVTLPEGLENLAMQAELITIRESLVKEFGGCNFCWLSPSGIKKPRFRQSTCGASPAATDALAHAQESIPSSYRNDHAAYRQEPGAAM